MGEGYWVLIWDGYGVGLNLINPRLLHDPDGNNWWPLKQTGLSDDEVVEIAVSDHSLPWMDTYDAPDDWKGSSTPSSSPVKYWKVIR